MANFFAQFDDQPEAPDAKKAPDNFFSQFDGPNHKPSDGGFKASAKQTIGQTIKGVGQAAADYLPGVSADNALSRYGQSVVDANPTAVHGFGDLADKPWTGIKETLGNALTGMGGMVAARALGQGITAAAPLTGPAAPLTALLGQGVSWGGPALMAALPSYSGIREAQQQAKPEGADTAADKALALGGAALVGGIESRFGPQDWALKAMSKEGRDALAEKFAAQSLKGAIGKGLVKGAGIEGAEELAQNPIEQLASYRDPTTRESLAETAFGGVMGAIGGGVLGGAGGGVNYIGQGPQKPAGPLSRAAETATATGAAQEQQRIAAEQSVDTATKPAMEQEDQRTGNAETARTHQEAVDTSLLSPDVPPPYSGTSQQARPADSNQGQASQPPSGSFGNLADFEELLNAERGDIVGRRNALSLAQDQATRREQMARAQERARPMPTTNVQSAQKKAAQLTQDTGVPHNVVPTGKEIGGKPLVIVQEQSNGAIPATAPAEVAAQGGEAQGFEPGRSAGDVERNAAVGGAGSTDAQGAAPSLRPDAAVRDVAGGERVDAPQAQGARPAGVEVEPVRNDAANPVQVGQDDRQGTSVQGSNVPDNAQAEIARRQAGTPAGQQTQAAPKEPWQITRSGFIGSHQGYSKASDRLSRATKDYSSAPDARWNSSRKWQTDAAASNLRKLDIARAAFDKQHNAAIGQHRQAVEKAIKQGRPVPPEVLADYPDLQQGQPHAQPAPSPAAPAGEAVDAAQPKQVAGEAQAPAGENGKETSGEIDGNSWSLTPYRFAKNSVALSSPSKDGFKTRLSRIAEAIGGRYVNRAKAYVLSEAKARRAVQLAREGWDAGFDGKLVEPKAKGEPSPSVAQQNPPEQTEQQKPEPSVEAGKIVGKYAGQANSYEDAANALEKAGAGTWVLQVKSNSSLFDQDRKPEYVVMYSIGGGKFASGDMYEDRQSAIDSARTSADELFGITLDGGEQSKAAPAPSVPEQVKDKRPGLAAEVDAVLAEARASTEQPSKAADIKTTGIAPKPFDAKTTIIESRGTKWRITVDRYWDVPVAAQYDPDLLAWKAERGEEITRSYSSYTEWSAVASDKVPADVAKKARQFFEQVAALEKDDGLFDQQPSKAADISQGDRTQPDAKNRELSGGQPEQSDVLNTKGDTGTKFKRTQSSEPIAPQAFKQGVQSLRSAFPGVRIIPHNSDSAPSIPYGLRAEIAKAKSANGEGMAGAFHDGAVHVFRSGIMDAAHLEKTVVHELTHRGLARMFGLGINKPLNEIYASNPKVAAAADQLAKRYGYAKPIATEEVLADMGAEMVGIKGFDKLVSYVRAALRKLGMVSEWSDNDVALLVQRAREKSRGGVTGSTRFAPSKTGEQTINVDGVERPRLNSNGKPIHTTEEGIRNFWRWFSPSPRQMLAGLSQAEVDSLKRHTKALSDFLERSAIGAQSGGQINIPRAVFLHVAGVVHDQKILDTVVRSLPVDVVNFLGRKEWPAQDVLHDASMLEDVFSINPASNVSLGIDPAAIADLTVRLVANAGAKITGLTSGALERNSAMLADTSNPVFGAHVKRSPNKDLSIIAGFGDSKVVDEQGRPLVVYHGTAVDFRVFSKKLLGSVTETSDAKQGFWFTDSPKRAGMAAEDAQDMSDTDSGANIMPVYLRLNNLLESWVIAMDPSDTAKELRKAKRDGNDGAVFLQGELGGVNYVAFRPEQIKSATGNNGDFSSGTSDVRFSRAGQTLKGAAQAVGSLFGGESVVGNSGRPYTPEQEAFFRNTGRIVTKPTLQERMQALWKDAGKKLAQGIVDQFAPIKELSGKAYMLARLSKGATGAFEALLHHGKLSLRDGVYDADQSGGAVEKVFAPLQGEGEDFLWWVAANRAERLSQEDREHLFTPQDVAAGKGLADGQLSFDYTLQNSHLGHKAGEVTRSRKLAYHDTLKTFEGFNRNVMDMAEQSGLVDGEARKLWEHEFYVPFYRVSDEDGFRGANIKSALVRQEAFKHLKGGADKLNSDLLANTLQNWAHLIDASAKNRAAKETLDVAVKMGAARPAIPGEKKTVWYNDGGKKAEFKVEDPYLMTAISSLEYAGLRGPMMDAMSKFKHVLTIGVTASPFFKIRNLIRDSISAIGVSDLGYNPLTNIKEGIKASDRSSQTHVSMLAAGGLIRFGTMLEGKESDRVRQLVKSGVKDSTILDTESKFRQMYDKYIDPAIAAYNELGNRGEEINRAALYKQLRDKGMDHATASFMARDLMDFSMQGAWSSVRLLTQVVPFMNARLQGLYKLGRGAKENPRKFGAVLGSVALASIMLMLAYQDDDDWKKREDWDRDNYWWFKMGGEAFRIPKPFEIGAIGSLAERGLEYMISDEMTGKRLSDRFLALLSDNLSMNPVPQLVKPVLDVYANKDSFSGRPIETMGMDRLAPEYRYTTNTSMTARALSTAGNAVTGVAGKEFLSPVQIDQMIRGYFGWLGTFVVGSADRMVRPLTDEPATPAVDYWKLATGGMVQSLDGAGSRYVSQLYQQAKIVEEAYATYRQLLKDGRVEEAKDYFDDNTEEITGYRRIEALKRQESQINARIRQIEKSDMPADKKRDEINSMRAKQDRTARLMPAAGFGDGASRSDVDDSAD